LREALSDRLLLKVIVTLKDRVELLEDLRRLRSLVRLFKEQGLCELCELRRAAVEQRRLIVHMEPADLKWRGQAPDLRGQGGVLHVNRGAPVNHMEEEEAYGV
jgi:hypothetical protein